MMIKFIAPILLVSCFSYPNNSSLENMTDEEYFYTVYPELKGKVANLRVSIERPGLREMTSYYKFVLKESDANNILQKEGYKKFNSTILNRMGQAVKCDHSFMKINDQENSSINIESYNDNEKTSTIPIWWDIANTKNYSCFLVLHDQSHYRVRALYEHHTKTWYMYRHTAG